MHSCFVFALVIFSIYSFADEQNDFENSGFESWNHILNLPSDKKSQWMLPPQEPPFSIFEQSNKYAHSGNYSLHIKDDDKRNVNQFIAYRPFNNKSEFAWGKIIKFSLWVKQIHSSTVKKVGIGISVRDNNGKNHYAIDKIDSCGETDWLQLKTKLLCPEGAREIRFVINCAGGWGQTAEAYFDDAVITIEKSLAVADNSNSVKSLPSINAAPINHQADTNNYLVEKYSQNKVYTSDRYNRPIIKNGTFYLNNQPIFFSGPWIYNRKYRDWNSDHKSGTISHPAYNDAPSKEIFEIMGFNSCQISSAWSIPGHALSGWSISPQWQKEEKEIDDFFGGFKDFPLVLDFAFIHAYILKKDNIAKYKELEQRNPYWHQFIPFCPEHPEGDRIYRNYFLTGTQAALMNNANVMVYELFNESSYFCECRYNRHEFAQRMERKYTTIQQANKIWGTIFDDFREVAEQSDFHQYKKLWPDWCKFMSHRYVEILKKYTTLIKTIDKRPNVYFTEQLSGGNIFTQVGAGMDYRLIAKQVDLLAHEGGWKFGKAVNIQATNSMEDVVFETGLRHWFVTTFFQALAKGEKPIFNDEHYIQRFEHGIRVPSKKEDMITSLWNEIFHGASGNFPYCWDKRSWEWKTFDEAKENVITPSYKSSSFLNPYNWPPENLSCFKEFMIELEPYKEQILPFPRTKPATVAIFFSYPTLRMLSYHNNINFQKRMLRCYSALLEEQYPVCIIFEEELKAGLPKDIKALIVPCAEYATPESVKDIEAFSNNGGIVIADKNAFAMDEYSNPLPEFSGNIKRVNIDDSCAGVEIKKYLENRKTPRYGVINPLDGRPIAGTNLEIIDRGDFKMIFIVSMDELETRLVNVKIFLNDMVGSFYLSDIIKKQLLIDSNGNEKWDKKSLNNDGFILTLPPQERVLLVLKRNRTEALTTMSPGAIKKMFMAAKSNEAEQLAGYIEKEKELRQKFMDARIYKDVKCSKCAYVDISNFANMDFADDKAEDQKGGWFDQGSNDFSKMALGQQTLAGVPFCIIDPSKNNNKSAIILYGGNRDFFPKAIKGMKINLFAEKIYFLHTMGWGAPKNTTVMTYIIRYDNDTEVKIPIRSGFEISSWWGDNIIPNARIAVESSNPFASKINMQCFAWRNPFPERKVKELDIISACGEGVPAIVAISVQMP